MTVVQFKNEMIFYNELEALSYAFNRSGNREKIVEKLVEAFNEFTREEIEKCDEDFLVEAAQDMDFLLNLIFDIEEGLYYIDWTTNIENDNLYWIVTEIKV